VREEHILKVSENRVLRRIFGHKWREEFHNLNASTNIIRVIKSSGMRWDMYVAHMREMRRADKISVGKF
jgi:hypothetical protein